MIKPILTGVGLIMAATCFTGCSDDSEPKGNGQAGEQETRYIRVAISNPSGSASRAENNSDNFEVGTDAENAVRTMYFKFFDINGDPVATSEQPEYVFDDASPEQGAPNVGKIKEVVAQFSLTKGQNYPTYVVCVINPVSFDEINTGINNSMEQLRMLVRHDYKTLSGNFSMSNAAYYGYNPITGAPNVKMMGAPILGSQIYKTQEEAKAATADPVNIYVERYAAKVRFTINTDNGNLETYRLTSDPDYELEFNPEAWTVNADEPTTYIMKRFDNFNAGNNPVPTFDEVNRMLAGWTTWNDPDNHRSYWGCSPAYYISEFPRVSDDVIDKAAAMPKDADGYIDGVRGSRLGAGVAVAPYGLNYYSYNQITDPALRSKGQGVTEWKGIVEGGDNLVLPCKYVLENTMNLDAFNSLNPKASAPSVLVVGNYTVKNKGNAVNTPDGFCIYGGKLYYNNMATTTGAPEGAASMLDAFLLHNQILTTSDGVYLNASNLSDAQKNIFEVVHPSIKVRGDQAIPQRYVTLQVKQGTTMEQLKTLFYRPSDSHNVVSVTSSGDLTRDEIITNINLLLLQQLGTAHMFNRNKCYFSIPIKHVGITENTATQSPVEADGSINWKNARRGDFGIVRNHVYTLSVSKIKGLASGIDDFDAPIVPPMEIDSYWVNYQIKILNWRIVPVQSDIVLE